MDENPYQPPKELNSRPTARQGIAIGVLLLLAIPSGCVCGGVTCLTISPGYPDPEGVSLWGIILGLAVVVAVPILAVYFFGKRTDPRS